MIDKRLLTDTVTVTLVGSKDEWGKVTYQEEFELSNVRFDRRIIRKETKAGATQNPVQDKPGVIFIYPKFTNVTINDEWINAIVKDEYSTYTVIGFNVNPLFNGKVFSYELEVI